MEKRLEKEILVTIQGWDKNTKPIVSIQCITYNHENYIREAIEGFLMQKTNFPVEILIHDDASTDNTANIIREYEVQYPQIIKPIFQAENLHSKKRGAITRIQNERSNGKYIAMCEGDDYWTDPLKLQKQIDFLESHPDYTLTVSGFKSIKEGESKEIIESGVVSSNQENEEGFTFLLEDTLEGWKRKILTAVFINNKSAIAEYGKYKYSNDNHLFYHLLKEGKGYYFKQVFGVYNMHEGGVYSLKSQEENLHKAYLIYQELYEVNKDEINRRRYLRSTEKIIDLKVNKGQFKDLQLSGLLREILSICSNTKEKLRVFKLLIPLKLKKIRLADKN
ncbi:MAG: glycosyltransferase family 2 protein [Aequorivita sp.]